MAQWVIGLTGPTGAGKSIVGEVFAEHGFPVVDTDRVARQVTQTDPDCLKELQGAFGEDVVQNGVLNRQELARRAFSTPGGGERLNRITHPRILKRADEIIAAAFSHGAPLALLDAPLLYESGADQTCQRVIAVVAPAQTRIERIMRRDGISLETAQLRLSAQKNDGFYTERADYVLVNDGTQEQLRQKAAQVLVRIRQEQEGDAMNQVERFWQIETDLEPLGLCRWSLEPGKSVPAGAVVFASLGVDGIQFCVLPDPGDEKLERAPVYAVSPQNPEHVLEPLAEDLLHFFSLVVQVGDAGILESASYCSRMEFEDALSSPGLGADFEQERKLASAALESIFPLFKIPDPFGYLERMRLRFPRNVIQFDRKTDEFPQETEQ